MKPKDPVADGLVAMLIASNRQDRIPHVLNAYLNGGEESSAQKAEKYLTTKQAAEKATCCGKSLFRAEQRGQIHAIRRSRRSIRWRESDILKWIEGTVAE